MWDAPQHALLAAHMGPKQDGYVPSLSSQAGHVLPACLGVVLVAHCALRRLDEALKHYMVDFACRMKEIKAALDRDTADAPAAAAGRDTCDASSTGRGGEDPGALDEKEARLEALMESVESIDYARGDDGPCMHACM